MSPLVRIVRQHRTPTVPVEISDAVERWAREFGRHAHVEFVTHTDPPTPVVKIELKSDDPRRQNGTEYEEFYLWEWDPEAETHPETGEPIGAYVGKSLTELGVTGVLRELNKANTWSGRGEYDDLEEGVREQYEKAVSAKDRLGDELREESRELGAEVRRQVLDIPFHRVGAEIGDASESSQEHDA